MVVKGRDFPGLDFHGLLSAQYILSNRRFRKIILEPPDFNPGSWRGAGKVLLDTDDGSFWLTTRPRRAHPIRGYAVEIYRSKDGQNFSLESELSKESVGSMAGLKVNSIEGQQLLRDPLTGKYHLYLSVDTPPRGWDTLLLRSDDPAGPWKSEGVVLKRDTGYDSLEARDATIDLIDGRYFAMYKANNGKSVRTALATSRDGVVWEKHGVLKLEGIDQPDYFLLCGKIFPSTRGPVFMGSEGKTVIDSASVTDTFASYTLDYGNLNLERLLSGRWEPLSPYERTDYPIHSYIDMMYDPPGERLLIYIEAIDPRDIGLNKEVDRVLLYEVPFHIMSHLDRHVII